MFSSPENHNDKGFYTVLYSHETQLKLALSSNASVPQQEIEQEEKKIKTLSLS
jgi:hypothetical protein